jgi:hypothetical protein
MSTHPFFIKALAEHIKPKFYLELGLYEGETFNLISEIVPNCVGVDVNLKTFQKKGIVYQQTTDSFFENNKIMFDMIFIDADHSFEQVKKDFENSIKILNPLGIIILHDTDPCSEKLLQPGYCGDSYKMISYLHSANIYNILPLPISDPGLSIVNRKTDTRLKLLGIC